MNYPILIPPASKSYSHRYIIGAFLSKHKVYLDNLSDCEDIDATKQALKTLGLSINGRYYSGEHTIFTSQENKHQSYTINAQGSATLSRFLSCILGMAPTRYSFTLTGNTQLQQRTHTLTSYYTSLLNTTLEYTNKIGYLPYTLTPQKTIATLNIELPPYQYSSQYISGLLFALSLAQSRSSLTLSPYMFPSFPYICSSIFTLQQYGIALECLFSPSEEEEAFLIEPHTLATKYSMYPQGKLIITYIPSSYTVLTHTIPSDFSAISYLLCFGILGKTPVIIPYTGINAPQADTAIITLIRSMGGRIEHNNTTLIAYPSRDALRSIDIDISPSPDLFPTLAILQAFARGRGRIYNIEHIRTKESNRVHAMLTGLYALGFDVQEDEHAVFIGERSSLPSHTISLSSFNDHRIAMAFSLCNIVTRNTCSLDEYSCVKKSFPNYWELFHSLS